MLHIHFEYTKFCHDCTISNSLLKVRERFLYVDFKSLRHSNSNCCMILQSSGHTPIHYTG